MGYGLDELNDWYDDYEDEDYENEEYGYEPRPINLHGERIEVLRLLSDAQRHNKVGKGKHSSKSAKGQKPTTRYDIMEPIYRNNALMKVGSTLVCPSCGEPFKKKSYQQKFCRTNGNKCKDYFWNCHPDRIGRTEEWKQ
ncbi:hypothetical protein ENTB43_032 [Enterobacter phage Entb_43]|nr:hypothetical protein ENTB43_032 [Enterobacter phage Entb_43]